MKQVIDLVIQFTTLVLGIIYLIKGAISIDEAMDYLAIAMSLVAVSLLYSRIQDKEDKQ